MSTARRRPPLRDENDGGRVAGCKTGPRSAPPTTADPAKRGTRRACTRPASAPVRNRRLVASRVFVRIRPFAEEGGHTVGGGEVYKKLHSWSPSSVALLDRHHKETFTFMRRTFGPAATQLEVFDATVRRDVATFTATDGVTACSVLLFAYGQTGTGKTHTILGPEASLRDVRHMDWGLFPRVVDATLTAMAAKGWPFQLQASAIEFYLTQAFDLLDRGPCIIGDNHRPTGTRHVPITCLKDVLPILETVRRNRTTCGTKMNVAGKDHSGSSRSHAALILSLHQVNPSTGDVLATTFDLVDLAGAERPGKVFDGERASSGDMLHAMFTGNIEPKHQTHIINYELHTVRTAVVNAAETHRRGRKLRPMTQLITPAVRYLTGCMTGKASLSMVVCMSPSPQHGWETWFACCWGLDLAKLRTPLRPEAAVSGAKLLAHLTVHARRTAHDLARTAPSGTPGSKYYVRRKAAAAEAAWALHTVEALLRPGGRVEVGSVLSAGAGAGAGAGAVRTAA